ncbi:ParA family protein [Parapedobacter soli]|uniref:ParA family protein n=1 Tax=Parapedobacter soli TaxID=416955 RepID=UPI0021C7A586|nr:ParA family protein [Parapedobacter soli]
MATVISVINHKGGTGKTTSTLNIGAGLAHRGKKVLLIDIDPQANLTEGLGVRDNPDTIYDSLSKNIPLPVIPVGENLSLVPSSLDLVGVELELVSKMSRETFVKKLLAPIKDDYDFILFDCPPSLGLLTINALVPSDVILIPLEAEYYAYRGIDRIVGIIKNVREHFNPELKIAGVFLTKCNPQRILTKDIRDSVKQYFGANLLDTYIRVNVSLAEAPAVGKDIFSYAPDSNGATDYGKLIDEILTKI